MQPADQGREDLTHFSTTMSATNCPFPPLTILETSELPSRADAIEVMARAIHTHYCCDGPYDLCQFQMTIHRKDAAVALDAIWTETVLSG